MWWLHAQPSGTRPRRRASARRSRSRSARRRSTSGCTRRALHLNRQSCPPTWQPKVGTLPGALVRHPALSLPAVMPRALSRPWPATACQQCRAYNACRVVQVAGPIAGQRFIQQHQQQQGAPFLAQGTLHPAFSGEGQKLPPPSAPFPQACTVMFAILRLMFPGDGTARDREIMIFLTRRLVSAPSLDSTTSLSTEQRCRQAAGKARRQRATSRRRRRLRRRSAKAATHSAPSPPSRPRSLRPYSLRRR